MTNFLLRSLKRKGWPSISRLSASSAATEDLAVLIASLILYSTTFFPAFSKYIIPPLLATALSGIFLYWRKRSVFQITAVLLCLISLTAASANATAIPSIRLLFFPTVSVTPLFAGPAASSLIFVATALSAYKGALDPVQSAAFPMALAASALPVLWVFTAMKRKSERMEQELLDIRSDMGSISSRGFAESESFLEQDRFSELIFSITQLKQSLDETVSFVKEVIPCNTAAYFSVSDEGILIKSHITDSPPLSDKPILSGTGYLGNIVTKKTHVQAGSISSQRLRPPYYDIPVPVRSFLGVPVMDSGVVVGILAVDSLEENAFYDRDRSVLGLVADQIMESLRRASVYRRIGDHALGFKALYDINSKILGNIKLSEVPDRLVEESYRVVSNTFCALFMEERGKYRLKAVRGETGRLKKTVFSKKDTILGWIDKHKSVFPVADLKARPMDNLPFQVPGMRSFIGLPLLSEGNTIGILTIGSDKPDAFRAMDVELLKMLASSAATSIANAKLHSDIELMSITDGLTGLLNHQNFQARLSAQFELLGRYPEQLSMLLMDIDHFKRVNDTYGHPAGDIVLKGVARILKKTLRTVDVAARYGGEEFAALLIKTDRRGAFRMAERLRKAILQEVFSTAAGDLRVTTSIGISSFPDDADSRELLIECADQALYFAKNNGRNRTCSFPDISTRGAKEV